MSNKEEMSNRNLFISNQYSHYMIQYRGVYNNNIKLEDMYITVIDKNYAILSIRTNKMEEGTFSVDLLEAINKADSNFGVVYIQPPELYTLEEMSAIEASDVNLVQGSNTLNLTGKGVVVGIIDTGIDYLNDEFIDEYGKTRINSIWDQTISSVDKQSKQVPFGAVYEKGDINKAIEVKRNGGNPYDVVPSKDEDGHGTSMASIVGARGKNPALKGMAPECEFVIVKLAEAITFKERNGFGNEIRIFESPVIFAAIEFLKEYLLNEKKSVVILLPLGTNTGNHKGENILDNYIKGIVNNIGIAVVSGSGNEGNEDGHVSGIITNKDEEEVVEVIISETQKDFFFDIWVDLPNIMEVNLISPSGQATGGSETGVNYEEKYEFIIEKTRATINYYFAEKYSGDQLIRIYLGDAAPGIWSLVLKLKFGNMARFNGWMLQKGIVKKGTRFSPSDPYGTITIPGDSTEVITVAAYNQNNNNLLTYSGKAFKDDRVDKIDFAAGGVNTLTVGLNNTTNIINGTSVSAAIGAGVCCLLFEWAIVNGNYPRMYTQSIKTFLRRGTIKRKGDTYPNFYLGYGIINLYQIFQNMQ